MKKVKFKKSEIFIVVPAYNEEERVLAVLKGISRAGHKFVVVDDGSNDKTFVAAQKAGGVVLKHKLNLGKGAALKTGCEAAFALGAKAVIVLDADGQHNPKKIPDFMAELNRGNDIVFGFRDLAGKAPVVRFAGNRLGGLLIMALFGIYRKDLLCGYLALTENTYKKVYWSSARYGVETEIVARTGKHKLRYSEVPIETIYIDKYKGVSLIDALAVLPSVFKWKFLE